MSGLLVALVLGTLVPYRDCIEAHDLTNNYVLALKQVTASVLTTHSYCSGLNLLFESGLEPTILHKAAAFLTSDTLELQSTVSAALILDLSLNANTNDSSKTYYYENGYEYKFHQPCTVLFYQLNSELLDSSELLNNGTVGHRWPERILPLLPNDVPRSFFTFFTFEIDLDLSQMTQRLDSFMHETAMILYSVFLVPLSVEEIGIFKGVPKSSQGLRRVVTLKVPDFHIAIPSQLFGTDFDFFGQLIPTLFYVVCAPKEEEVSDITALLKYNPFVNSWNSIYARFNATQEIETVFGIPDDGVNPEDGEFNDFLIPLVTGTAALNSITVPSKKTSHVVKFSKPYVYDHVVFITGPAKVLADGGIWMLKDPLDWEVWVALFVSSVIVFGSLVGFKRAAGQSVRSVNFGWIRLVDFVFVPLLFRQPVFSPWRFSVRVNAYGFYFLVSIWYLCLIVLYCAYDSALLGILAYPQLHFPPRTFRELAASDYEIGAILASTIGQSLEATGLASDDSLFQRLVEHDIADSTCYQGVLERKMACIGIESVLNTLGSEYLVDRNGKKISMRSKDTRFPMLGLVGVSKFFPMFLEPLDHHLSAFENTGFTLHWRNLGTVECEQKGMRFARRETKKKYYQRSDGQFQDQLEKVNEKILEVTLEVLLAGAGISVAVFLAELALRVRFTGTKCSHRAYVRWGRRKVYEPKVYMDELLGIEIRNMAA